MMSQKKTYSVTELTRLIRRTLEQQVGSVWVQGEASNVRSPASGHVYFTLKDSTAQIRVVLFRGSQRAVTFQVKDGMEIRAAGEISVYERSGEYQLIAKQIEDAGAGDLQRRFDALKESLSKEGLFDARHKKMLPVLPRHVGVVTSATGAAVRDIINVMFRRFPNLHMTLVPVRVQGDGAAREIAEAIDRLNQLGCIDVIIVGRGGGSVEDLWCFNEEIVARAVFRSVVPVVSAVGHEIDFTICDFVADVRAPTPSAAAELVVARKDQFEQQINELNRRLGRALTHRVQHVQQRLRTMQSSYVFREPQNMVRQFRQQLDTVCARIGNGLQMLVDARRRRVEMADMNVRHALRNGAGVMRQSLASHRLRLVHCGQTSLLRRRQALDALEKQLRLLSPTAVLERGFSITFSMDGKVLRNASNLQAGERMLTRFTDGVIQSKVEIQSVEKE